jgi:hypothetical protein
MDTTSTPDYLGARPEIRDSPRYWHHLILLIADSLYGKKHHEYWYLNSPLRTVGVIWRVEIIEALDKMLPF